MSSADRFEAGLETRLRSLAETAVVRSDAGEIARAAIAATPRRAPRLAGLLGTLPRPAAIGLLIVLAALLAVIAVGIGARFVRPAPAPFGGGTFQEVGQLVIPRANHQATLLADGRVLVVDGVAERGSDEAEPLPPEIFDTTTGQSTLLPEIEIPTDGDRGDRETYSSTLLADGRVLVAGGRPGGEGVAESIATAVLYDPATGVSVPTGAMAVPRYGHGAVRLGDGRVLVLGGAAGRLDALSESLASAEIYDPATGVFTPTGDMRSSRMAVDFATDNPALTATLLPSGRVLVVGGIAMGDDSMGPATGPDEIYDPATGTFESVLTAGANEPDPIVHLAIHEKVYRYDLRTGTATDITPQPADLVAEFGPDCERLAFGCRGSMVLTRLDDGHVLFTGGHTYVENPPGSEDEVSSQPILTGEYFDLVSGAVAPTGPMVRPRVEHSATLLPDGRVVLLGGFLVQPVEPGDQEDPPRVLLTSAELFTP